MLDDFVETCPVAVGVLIADLLTGKGTILIAEHCDVRILGRWVREEVGGREPFWCGFCGRDREEECCRGAKGEDGVSGG